MYLRLEVSNSRIHTQYQMSTTQDTCTSFLIFFTGLSPSMVSLSREFQVIRRGLKASLKTPHFYYISITDSVCSIFCFLSLILTESLLISLPSGTKMFQFPEFLILSDLMRISLRNLWFKNCMRFTKDFRSLPRPSSASKA